MKLPVLGSLALFVAVIAPQTLKLLSLSQLSPLTKTKSSRHENKAHFDQSQNNSRERAAVSFSGNVQQEWVRHFSSGRTHGIDVATAITADGRGYVYVTGYSSSLPFGLDYLTLKYHTPSGNLIWSARFTGEGYDNDIPVAIAVDAHGNVVVTGQSRSASTGVDYATVKYDRNGVQQWAAHYGGNTRADDYATHLAMDSSGNVYVTGYSYETDEYYHCVTVKYDSLGAEQWVAHYRGAERSNDKPAGLVLYGDDAGQFIYITGSSAIVDPDDRPNNWDYFTLKYDAAGQQLWSARYDSANGNDEASDLAADDDGNLYVTGRSAGAFLTIKYDRDGGIVWKARNSGGDAFALGLDSSANIYISGVKNYDPVTIKYSNDGIQLWSVTYSTDSYTTVFPKALAVDPDGNTYLTGFREYSRDWRTEYFYELAYITYSYDAYGDLRWVAAYGDNEDLYLPPAMAQDDSGNIFIAASPATDSSRHDFLTLKYNRFGVFQWAKSHEGPGSSSDIPAALTVDKTGNVHATGTAYIDAVSYNDIATVKYNGAGDETWRDYYGGGDRVFDVAHAAAVDDTGNVYVAGSSYSHTATGDLIIMKYNSAGAMQWLARHRNDDQTRYDACAIAVDRSGHVYAVGATIRDLTLLKYEASGLQKWVARQDCPTNRIDERIMMAVDDSGNVCLARTRSDGNRYPDIATFKFGAAGSLQWIARYGAPPSNVPEETIGLAVDINGNVYVTGVQGGNKPDYVTIKYTPEGIQQWAATYDGPGDEYGASRDEAADVAVDSTGNVYVTGTSTASGSKQDYLTIKYDKDGTVLWTARYNGPQNSYDKAAALALDANGNVYVTGYNYYSQQEADFITIKYNAEGQEEWVARYHGQADSRDYAAHIVLDTANNVFVLGKSLSGYFWDIPYSASVYTTIKYSQTNPVTVQERNPNLPVAYNLFQNFPNPFNPSTTIRYNLAKDSHVKLQVFDLAGREVAILLNEIESSGSHDVHWNATSLPSGIYLYRLEVSNSAADSKPIFIQTRKLILMK